VVIVAKNLSPKEKLWGISSIFIGLVGLLVSLVLVVKPVIFPQASANNQPQAVRLSNFSENSVTVSWVTDEAVLASVSYADNNQLQSPQVAFDDRGKSIFSKLHHITLKNLKPAATYYFQLTSGKQEFNYQGQPYSASTLKHISFTPLPPNVFTDQLENEALVYFQSPDSTLISTITDVDGKYLLVKDKEGSFTFHDGQKTWTQGQIPAIASQLPAPKPARKPLIVWPSGRRQRPQASEIKISNVTDSSLSIAWLTDKSARAAIALSTQSNRLFRFFEFFFCQYFGYKCRLFTDEIRNPSTTHFVTLKNLEPETSYFYRLVADSHFLKYDQQDNILPPIKTSAILEEISLPQPVFGPVFESDNITPVKNALIYINLLDSQNRNIIKSQPIMTYTDRQGIWLADLGNLRSFDMKNPANPQPGDLLFIKVWAADGRKTAEFIPYSNIKAIKAIILR